MPVTVSYPGVYVSEIPSGVRTITGVATSIAAFVGRTQRGPTDEAVMVNSYGDFERGFGGIWADSTLGYAVRDFFMNGGSQAVIVRLYHPKFASTSDNASAKAAALAIVTATASGTDLTSAAGNAHTVAIAYTAQPEAAAALAVSDAVATAAAANGATLAKVNAAATQAAAQAAPTTKAQIFANSLVLEAKYEGSWGNNLRVRIDHDVAGGDVTLFNLFIRDGLTGQVELFRNVSVDPASLRCIDKVLENDSNLMRVNTLPGTTPAAHGNLGTGENDLWAGANKPATSSGVLPADIAADGGLLEANDFTGPGKEGAKEGLYALETADLFNILCIPPFLAGGDVDQQVVTAAAIYCEKRRAMLLVDPPSGWNTKDKAKSGIATDIGTTSKNAALFFPRLRQPDPARGGQVGDFAPCGAVAGIFARTDATRGVWKAPAGLDATLVGVPELTVPLTDGENGELNPLGINCLRTMPAAGRIVWGSRTLQGDDRLANEWKYVPVRRVALFIEESLYRGTQWVVFEPNDEPLWAQIRLNLGAFMHDLYRKGAFQGASPKDAYFVKCDKETTTQNDVNVGVVNIVVGFAPLKPAEFVIISIQQMAGQIQV